MIFAVNHNTSDSDCCFVPTHITNVRQPSDLPFKETGFGGLPSYSRHRCEVKAVGFAAEEGGRPYDFDNRARRSGCLFQFTLSGEGCFQCLPRGRTVVVGPGQAFLAPFPSPTRYWLARGNWWEFCYAILDGDMAYDLVGQLVRQYGYVWDIAPDSAAIDAVRYLHRRALDGRAPDEFEAAAVGHRLLMELFRLRQAPQERFSEPVRKAMRLIEREYRSGGLTVDRLARVSGYSRYHFTRLFRMETGMAPHKYVQKYRVRRALELMASTRLSVKQVAMETGFSGCAYFCKEFRRWTRRTPTDLRKLGPQFRLGEVMVG